MIPEGRVAIVSHDAGGAEILSSLAKRNDMDYLLSINGPATKIFESKLTKIKNYSLNECISKANWVLTGTSWSSDLEYKAIALGKENNKYVISFLDHWVNYRERFIRSGLFNFPNELWVGDDYAFNLAKRVLPEIPLVNQLDNPYFIDLKEQLKHITENHSERIRILYVCEPTSEHALKQYGDELYWGYTEYEALRHFMSKIDRIFEKDIERITVRPHPSEHSNKFHFIIDEFPHFPIEINSKESLIKEVAAHNTIVGCNTMAMVIGLLNSKRVLCSIPNSIQKCLLPYDEIERIQ